MLSVKLRRGVLKKKTFHYFHRSLASVLVFNNNTVLQLDIANSYIPLGVD